MIASQSSSLERYSSGIYVNNCSNVQIVGGWIGGSGTQGCLRAGHLVEGMQLPTTSHFDHVCVQEVFVNIRGLPTTPEGLFDGKKRASWVALQASHHHGSPCRQVGQVMALTLQPQVMALVGLMSHGSRGPHESWLSWAS